jgi:hypothetical protein
MPGEMSIGTDERGHLQYTALVPVSEWVVEGSLIRSHNGNVVIVHKVNPKNYVCYDEQGQGWNVRISSQKPLDPNTQFDRTAYLAFLQRERDKKRGALDVALSSDINIGSIVQFKSVTQRNKYPGAYVSCSWPNRDGKVRLAKLGSDGGRYWAGFPIDQLEVVSLSDLKELL